jgi:WD40 repeat protein
MFDSGNSVGEIRGHTKCANAGTIRPVRPYRLVTCSDDSNVHFYHGPPFKFNTALREHTGFVHSVRYSPSGDRFVSVGTDSKVRL